MDRYDIVIVGSGFAGSLLAMIAKRLGRSVLLLERGTHPRVVIGESSTPLSNLLLEELAIRYDLPAVQSLAKWGTWQRTHPELSCGLKRGFTFHHHVLGKPAPPDSRRRDQLLVAASPHDEIADTHWYRADFDFFLVKEAQAMGVDYLDRVELRSMEDAGDEVVLEGMHQGSNVTYSARFVVDATGPRGFLHLALGLDETQIPTFPRTQALYSHFSGVGRLIDGNYSRVAQSPPYPIDAAAVHHVFDGGWIWVLQFNNGITSAGVAATDRTAEHLKLREGESAWERLLNSIPALREQFRASQPVRNFTYMANTAFRSAQVIGRRWALLPSAAGFVDPLLSTGFPLTLLGVTRLAEVIEHHWDSSRFDAELCIYATKTDDELLATGRLIGSLYASMDNFRLFTALTLLYFTAATYSETARRLNKHHLATSFLLHDHPTFGSACLEIFERAHQVKNERETADLVNRIREIIEPFNVAGLGDPNRRNWYAVDPNDLLKSAWKLEASQGEVQELLHRCGFVSSVA